MTNNNKDGGAALFLRRANEHRIASEIAVKRSEHNFKTAHAMAIATTAFSILSLFCPAFASLSLAGSSLLVSVFAFWRSRVYLSRAHYHVEAGSRLVVAAKIANDEQIKKLKNLQRYLNDQDPE